MPQLVHSSTTHACTIMQACSAWLTSLPVDAPIALGLSGGLDSSVLLHGLVRAIATEGQSRALYALHIHHGLSANADAWLTHCEQSAYLAGVAFQSQQVSLNKYAGNLEAQARQARYQALAELCGARKVQHLAVAHHQDDQAETLLLQLLRGAGVAGLAGMPNSRLLNTQLSLHRPLLNVPRRTIAEYAAAHHIRYVDDESNTQTAFIRNAVRHQAMPVLQSINPAATALISRSARHLAEAKTLLDELALADVQRMQSSATQNPYVLSLSALAQLSPARCRNAVRYWLRGLAPDVLALPEVRLNNFLSQCLPNSQASLKLGQGVTLRCWRDGLYWDATTASVQAEPAPVCAIWQGQSAWPLPEWGGVLHFDVSAPCEGGIAQVLLQGLRLEARARSGGERLQHSLAQPSRSLKNLFQEHAIPPWSRQVPVIWVEGKEGWEVLYVPYLGTQARYSVSQNNNVPKITLRWEATTSTAE